MCFYIIACPTAKIGKQRMTKENNSKNYKPRHAVGMTSIPTQLNLVFDVFYHSSFNGQSGPSLNLTFKNAVGEWMWKYFWEAYFTVG